MVQVIHFAVSSGHVFSFVCLFAAIYRNTFGSNFTICHQFRGNSARVNERDGGGNVSITAGLVLNELHMYLLSLLVCLFVCMLKCAGVCVCVFLLRVYKRRRGRNRGRAEIIEKKYWTQCLYDNACVCACVRVCVWDSCVMINGLIADLAELTPSN